MVILVVFKVFLVVKNLEILTQIAPDVSIYPYYFNTKSSNWSSNDTTTAEGAQLDYFTSLYGMKQVIIEPTHILESSASCIDLIFTNQPNIVMDSGVHLSLHEKCHHQIIYSKLKN